MVPRQQHIGDVERILGIVLFSIVDSKWLVVFELEHALRQCPPVVHLAGLVAEAVGIW